MIYVDTSVLLAFLLAEDKKPPAGFFDQALASSRLIEYETFNRLNAMNLTESHGPAAQSLLYRLSILEMTPPVLARALEPFPAPLRTLDALHLASADFLRRLDSSLKVASYDKRFSEAAEKFGFEVVEI